jgi:hypothetical protein
VFETVARDPVPAFFVCEACVDRLYETDNGWGYLAWKCGLADRDDVIDDVPACDSCDGDGQCYGDPEGECACDDAGTCGVCRHVGCPLCGGTKVCPACHGTGDAETWDDWQGRA